MILDVQFSQSAPADLTLYMNQTEQAAVYSLRSGAVQPCGIEKAFELSVTAGFRPLRMTAMYMLNDWWTRPAFITSWADIPERTQLLAVETEETCYCILPLVSDTYKTQLIPGTDGQMWLCVFSHLPEIQPFDEPVFLVSTAVSPRTAIRQAITAMAEIRGLKVRKERELPEMMRYLGWCSWDAFCQKVNAEGLERKAEELDQKKVPVRWFLIDDGWLSTQEKKLTAYQPDPVKFPEGFRPVIERIREKSGIRDFGVWHAVCGYWEGIADGHDLPDEQYLYRTADGNLYPSPQNGAGFYQRWYTYLKEQGISFVKVDGQSTVPNFFKGELSVRRAADGIADAIEEAADVMDRRVINCMGMAMETIGARKNTAVSRNSDDFVPSRGIPGFHEHLLQNAYNSLYHSEIYVCDWDMFWTAQEDAPMHALLRAASGGPVYFSDRVGDTVSQAVKPLVYTDGRVLMLERSLMPADACVFSDPHKEGVLKMHNYGMAAQKKTGAMAVFNLSGKTQDFTASGSEIEELEQDTRYVIYDWFAGTVSETCRGTLAPEEYRWYVFAPLGRHMASFGRTDKYTGFTAVQRWDEYPDCDRVILRESGPFAWYTETGIRAVTVNGIDVSGKVRQDGGTYCLDLEESSDPAEIIIDWA